MDFLKSCPHQFRFLITTCLACDVILGHVFSIPQEYTAHFYHVCCRMGWVSLPAPLRATTYSTIQHQITSQGIRSGSTPTYLRSLHFIWRYLTGSFQQQPFSIRYSILTFARTKKLRTDNLSTSASPIYNMPCPKLQISGLP